MLPEFCNIASRRSCERSTHQFSIRMIICSHSGSLLKKTLVRQASSRKTAFHPSPSDVAQVIARVCKVLPPGAGLLRTFRNSLRSPCLSAFSARPASAVSLTVPPMEDCGRSVTAQRAQHLFCRCIRMNQRQRPVLGWRFGPCRCAAMFHRRCARGARRSRCLSLANTCWTGLRDRI
jgi:hypothetical protein